MNQTKTNRYFCPNILFLLLFGYLVIIYWPFLARSVLSAILFLSSAIGSKDNDEEDGTVGETLSPLLLLLLLVLLVGLSFASCLSLSFFFNSSMGFTLGEEGRDCGFGEGSFISSIER